MLSCRLASGPLWLGIYPFLWWFLLVIFVLFLLHWRYELPCQDKLPEFHCTPILGCIRVLWLVFHPLGLRLDKALCGWNSVRMRPVKKGDGSPYYDYVLLYMDDVVSDNAESILRNEIGRYFELKEASIGPPKMYLGAGIRKVKLDNGMEAWAASSSQYIQAAVRNVEEYIEKSHHKRWRIPNKVETPMRSTYRPELDVSEELSPSDTLYYQLLIGILQ